MSSGSNGFSKALQAQNLCVSFAKTESANLIESVAEKEFEKRIFQVCQFAQEAYDQAISEMESTKPLRKEPLVIYYPKGLKENSKFWRSIVSSANTQTCVFREVQPDFETADAEFAQVENANGDG